jgi:hypothetical protein
VKVPRPAEIRRTPPPAGAEQRGLFADRSLRSRPFPRRPPAPELTAARVLCRALRRKRESAAKKRIVHLICLNLLAILKHRAQQT